MTLTLRSIGLWIFLLSVLFCKPGFTQASLSGWVTDQAGTRIPGAQITATLADASSETTTTSAPDGTFLFEDIPEGTYTLVIRHPGWQQRVVPRVAVEAKQSNVVPVTLPTPDDERRSSQRNEAKGTYFDEGAYKPDPVSGSGEGAGYSTGTQAQAEHDILAATSASKDRLVEPPDVQSEALIREALKRDGGNAELYHKLARLEEQRDNLTAAAEDYERAAHLAPTETHIFDVGNVRIMQHDYARAEAVFEPGLKYHPGSLKLTLGLGVSLYLQGKYRAALEQFISASDLAPSDPRPYFYLSETYPGQSPDDLTPALDHLRRFVQLDPDQSLAHFYYAVGLWNDCPNRTARLAEIKSSLEKALNLSSGIAEPHLYLGMVLDELDKRSEALEEYNRALSIQPDLETAHYRLAQTLARLGQKDRAAQEMQVFERLHNRNRAPREASRLAGSSR